MTTRIYEAMFLFDSGTANQWDAVEKEVTRLMERAEADVIGIQRWDERRLAYEIEHRKRGCYVLTHFRADASKIAPMERDAQLSEVILRLLVLRSELNEEQLEAFRKEAAEQATALRDEAKARAEAEKAAEEQKAAEAAAKAPAEPAESKPEQTETATETAGESGEPEAEAKQEAQPAAAPASSEAEKGESEAGDESSSAS